MSVYLFEFTGVPSRIGYMRVKFLIFIFLLPLLGLAGVYYYYNSNKVEILNDLASGKSDAFYFSLDNKKSLLLNKYDFSEFQMGTLFNNMESKWRNFFFKYFKLSLPVELPDTSIVPILLNPMNPELTLYSPGFRIVNSKQELLIEILPKKPFYFKRNFSDQKIFKLPSFKRFIFNTKLDVLNEKLFTSTLNIASFDIDKVAETLFLAHLRSIYFPEKATGYRFDSEKGVGHFLYPDKEEFEVFEVYFKNNRVYFPVEFRVLKNDSVAKTILKYFYERLELKESGRGIQSILFKEFQNLSYKETSTNYAYFLLLSAWSFNIEDEKVLKYVIQRSERGNAPLTFLGPIYKYAYKRYGDNFSEIDKRKKVQKELQLKVEIEKELKRANQAKIKQTPKPKLTPKEILEQKLRDSKTDNSKSKTLYQDN